MKIRSNIIIGTVLVSLLLVGCAATDPMAPYKNKTAQQILFDAEKDLKKNNFTDAIKAFEALDALYPFGVEDEQAQLDVVYAHFMHGDYLEAATAAEHYIHLYPRSDVVDYAYYMKGLGDFETGATWFQKFYHSSPSQHDLNSVRSAFNDFNELIRQFPDSKYANDAHLRMIFIRNVLAKHELEVAQFYFDHKAYIAAANRANYIVKHFQGAPQSLDALKLMIKSYRTIGADEQLDESIRIFKMNYPHEKI